MFLFFFKQKTAYDLRISDWSSDGCSSDLGCRPFRSVALNTTFLAHCDAVREGGNHSISLIEPEDDGCSDADGRHEGVGKAIVSGVDENGRGSCRERGGQDV